MAPTIKVRSSLYTNEVFNLSYEELYNYIKNDLSLDEKPPTYYEIIDGPCRAYVDIDIKTGHREGLEERKQHLEVIRKRLSRFEYKIVDGCRHINGVYKLSFHIIFRDLYFREGLAMKNFVSSLLLDGVDMSVYKKAGSQQLFRLPYNGKTAEDHKLIYTLKDNNKRMKFEDFTLDDFKECLISSVPKDATFFSYKSLHKDSDADIDLDVDEYFDNDFDNDNVESLEEHEEVFTETKEHCELDTPEAIDALLGCILKEGEQNIHWDDWKNIVWALRNISDENDYDLRSLAHTFSKASEKYDKKTTDKTYDNIDKYPNAEMLKMGSLVNYVKENHEDAYFAWKKKYRTPKNKELTLLFSAFRDGDLADYFADKYKDEFIYFEGKLYNYNGVYWEEKTNKVIFAELKKLFFVLLSLINKNFNQDDDTYKTALAKALQLRTLSKQKSFVELIIMELTVEEDRFDNNGDLLGFTNGTYELNNGIFREGRAEDYITMTVGYDYAPTSTHRISEFMSKVMPHQDERNALIEILATSLRGKTLEKFNVLTGEGGNGKDSLMTYLMKYVLGPFYFEANSSVLTDELRSELSPGIAAMHKKRLVVYNEPKKVIKVNMMKHLTGGSNIAVRGLYSNKVGIDLAASHFLLCNNKPKLDEVSEAVARRLIVAPFRSLFRSADDIKNEFSADTPYLYEGSDFFKSVEFGEEYKLEMMNLLLAAYSTYKNNKYNLSPLPRSMVNLAKEYMADCDEFYGWFITKYEKSTDENDFIQIKEIFNCFKSSSFYADLSKSARRCYTMKKLNEEIETNPNLRLYYKERHRPHINEKQKEFRNTLIKWKIKEEENDDED